MPLSGPLPSAAPPAHLSAGGGALVLRPGHGADAQLCVAPAATPSAVDAEEEDFLTGEEEEPSAAETLLQRLPVAAGDPRAACRTLFELLQCDTGLPAAPAVPLPCGDASEEELASPLGFLTGSRRLPVDADARVRPPICVRVNPAVYRGHPRVCSVLARGLKVRVPSAAPAVWRRTPLSNLMSLAVRDFVAAGILEPGVPTHCYRLFPVAKSASEARLVYDLSALTPYMPRRSCVLPKIERALSFSVEGFKFGIKLDLRDGFYHIPLAPCTRQKFGVLYDCQTYLFTRLPMGLALAPSEMQHFACATVKIVEDKFPGVRGLAYLDDFLFLARRPGDLSGIVQFFTDTGLSINFHKSVTRPTSRLCYLGVDLNLASSSISVKRDIIEPLRTALLQCSADWSQLSRQRLAGFVNFVRPCLKLPLEVVTAVLDGDGGACAVVAPFICEGVTLSFSDICNWNAAHYKHVFVDATTTRIGIVQQGC